MVRQEEEWAQFVSQIYDVVLEPERWTQVMDRFVDLLGARAALLQVVELDYAGNSYTIDSTYYRAPETQLGIQAYLEEVWHQEKILYDKVFQAPTNGFVTDYQCLGYSDPEQLENHAPSNWFRRNLGLYYRAASRLHQAPGIGELISIQYPADRRYPPTREELALADRCLPHFARVVELTRTFLLLKSAQDILFDSLDTQGVGILVLDAKGRVAHGNQRGRKLLGITVGNGAAPSIRNSHLSSAIQQALATAVGEEWHYPRQLRLERKRKSPLMVGLCCLGDPSNQMELRRHGLLLIVIDPDDLPPVEVSALASCYCFTPAETEVCQLLCNGYNSREIAEIRGVSQETVRSQIKQLFHKAGCSDRMQLLFEATRTQFLRVGHSIPQAGD